MLHLSCTVTMFQIPSRYVPKILQAPAYVLLSNNYACLQELVNKTLTWQNGYVLKDHGYISRLVPSGKHTPTFDCSIRVTRTNLTALIECLNFLLEYIDLISVDMTFHLKLDRHVHACRPTLGYVTVWLTQVHQLSTPG